MGFGTLPKPLIQGQVFWLRTGLNCLPTGDCPAVTLVSKPYKVLYSGASASDLHRLPVALGCGQPSRWGMEMQWVNESGMDLLNNC